MQLWKRKREVDIFTGHGELNRGAKVMSHEDGYVYFGESQNMLSLVGRRDTRRNWWGKVNEWGFTWTSHGWWACGPGVLKVWRYVGGAHRFRLQQRWPNLDASAGKVLLVERLRNSLNLAKKNCRECWSFIYALRRWAIAVLACDEEAEATWIENRTLHIGRPIKWEDCEVLQSEIVTWTTFILYLYEWTDNGGRIGGLLPLYLCSCKLQIKNFKLIK